MGEESRSLLPRKTLDEKVLFFFGLLALVFIQQNVV